MIFHRRPAGPGLPDRAPELLDRHVAVWRRLDDDERTALVERMDGLLTHCRWEAAQGFALDDRILTVIAAQASLLILGLDLDWYREVRTVIVHPTTRRVDRRTAGPAPGTESAGPVHLLGETMYEGPVVVSWDAASAAARHPERGHDVVLHEFAHAIDMLDDTVDGTPPIDDPDLAARWVEVNTAAFRALVDHGDPVIDDYGATSAGEFFAVVTEHFFTIPDVLAAEHPALYDCYRAVYRQDPRTRLP